VFVPSYFRVDDPDRLHQFIERNGFGTLVTAHAGGRVEAGHIPFLVVRDDTRFGRLEAHVARANEQWRELAGDALVIFQGPHVYISPEWYEAEEVVPTWNYVAVHAYGSLQIIEERTELVDLLRRSIEHFEPAGARRWTIERSGKAVERMLGGIVGFRIPIARLEGKWKLSQNHPVERQEKVAAALEAMPGEDAREVAALMRGNLRQRANA
jgi:transcriptional regulator